MLFRQIFDPTLAQYAYLVGCQQTGEAIVIDPERDIDRYLEIAAAEGLRITAVTETHIHADFLSGSRDLAEAVGAEVYLCDEGDEDWKYGWTGDTSAAKASRRNTIEDCRFRHFNLCKALPFPNATERGARPLSADTKLAIAQCLRLGGKRLKLWRQNQNKILREQAQDLRPMNQDLLHRARRPESCKHVAVNTHIILLAILLAASSPDAAKAKARAEVSGLVTCAALLTISGGAYLAAYSIYNLALTIWSLA